MRAALKRKESDWSLLLLVVAIPLMAVLVLLIQIFPIPPPHFPNTGVGSDPNLFFFTFLFLPFFVAIVLFCYMQVREITSKRPH